MNICEQAEAFRLLLIMGVASKAEIISWADELILARDELPGWLFDLSLAANGDDEVIESKLRDLPCEANLMTAAYSAMDRFAEKYRAGGVPAQTAARMLERWASGAKVNQGEWERAMMPSWIACEIDCGHASEQDVIASVDKCLAHFAAIRRPDG